MTDNDFRDILRILLSAEDTKSKNARFLHIPPVLHLRRFIVKIRKMLVRILCFCVSLLHDTISFFIIQLFVKGYWLTKIGFRRPKKWPNWGESSISSLPNSPEAFDPCRVANIRPLSDHSLVHATYAVPDHCQQPVERAPNPVLAGRINFHAVHQNEFKAELNKVDWEQVIKVHCTMSTSERTRRGNYAVHNLVIRRD